MRVGGRAAALIIWCVLMPYREGGQTVRRSAFVPILTDEQPYEPKGEGSAVPFYHYLGMALRWAKGGA